MILLLVESMNSLASFSLYEMKNDNDIKEEKCKNISLRVVRSFRKAREESDSEEEAK